MIFLYYNDLLPTFVILLTFSLFATFHRILLPNMYSSILIFKYTGDYIKTAKSSGIRILYVLLLTLFFYHYIKYIPLQIYLGIALACFLNVWPAIVQYHLLLFWRSKEKTLLLVSYLSFIVFSVFMAYVTINIISPMLFDNKDYAFFNNSGWNIIKTLILFIIPVSFESILANISGVVKHIDIDTFTEEVQILNHQLEIENEIINIYRYEINNISVSNNIPTELLETIVNLEYIYRGRWYNSLCESILCHLFPKFAIRKDISIGLTQIKISTAQKTLKMASTKFLKKLLEPDFNLEVCAKMLKNIIYDYYYPSDYDYMRDNSEDIYQYIAYRYLCRNYSENNKTVLLYSTILRNRVPNPSNTKTNIIPISPSIYT